MDIKEFAKSISGKEYGYPQFTKEEIQTANWSAEKALSIPKLSKGGKHDIESYQ